jgi:acetyltransferase-like isoleucine patch superfamily enzyme
VISGGVNIGENCFVGVNSTIRDHINIADKCVIGAGSIIMKDTQESGVYIAQNAELSKVPSHRLKGL